MTGPGAKDRRLDELLREFRPPPPPDAAALWQRIEPELDARRAPVAAPGRWRWSGPILAPTLAAAAIAAVVFATRPDRGPTAAADPDGPQVVHPPAPPVQHAVQEHFAATERFLRPVLTPGDAPQGGASPTVASGAANLLAQNDLLRASRAVAATPHRELLDDVELVLTQLAVDGSAGFAELTAGDVRLLDRLRAAAGEEARSD
jgi:hypothetical protein